MKEKVDLIFGCPDAEAVKDLKNKLNKLGADLNVDEFFDIRTHIAVKKFQEVKGLTADGWVGPITMKEIDSATGKPILQPDRPEVSVETKPTPPMAVKKPVGGQWYGAIWLGFMVPKIGWTEFSHDKELSKGWPWVGLPDYKTVIGTRHAWCAMILEMAFRSVQMIGSKSAAALSYKTFGEKAGGWWFGAPIHIKHAGGGNHATFFLYWVDKAKKLAACLGGNQSNKISIVIYNLSGNESGHESCPGGPRWPKGHPDGREVSEAEAKALIKNLGYEAVGSTR